VDGGAVNLLPALLLVEIGIVLEFILILLKARRYGRLLVLCWVLVSVSFWLIVLRARALTYAGFSI
jgi:hypothetical protein